MINEAGDHGGGSPLQEAKTGQPPEEERYEYTHTPTHTLTHTLSRPRARRVPPASNFLTGPGGAAPGGAEVCAQPGTRTVTRAQTCGSARSRGVHFHVCLFYVKTNKRTGERDRK